MVNIPQFKIGFTFRGSQKDTVEAVCEALLNYGYAKSDIFYYPWHQALVGGVGSANTLQEIYHNHCDYVVVVLSPDYAEGNWTGDVEWRSVRDLINTGRAHRICLLGVNGIDPGTMDGLYTYSDIPISIDGMDADAIARLIVDWIDYRS